MMSAKFQYLPWWENRCFDVQAFYHDIETLVEARVGLLDRHAEAGKFVGPVALADAEIEAAAGEKIDRRRLLGEQDRIVPGQHQYGRTEPAAFAFSPQARSGVRGSPKPARYR